MSSPLLAVEDLKTYFQSARGVIKAVDGVSFSVERGRTLGVVGESGSGKTVLARSVMHILPRKAAILAGGRVLFEGRDLRTLNRRELRRIWGREIAMVFQDPMTSLNPVTKIGSQIVEILRVHLNMGRAQARAKAVDLLREVGIPDPERRIDEYPHQLSGGMRQRVMIAIAIACEPKLLLADEPTTALDVTVQRQILDLLGRERDQRRMAMILVTHDLGVVAGRTDEIAVMYAARVVEQAPTSVLFAQMRHPYTEALLKSIPKLENPSHTRLLAIPGRPPDLVNPPRGCRFAPRCRYAQQRCLDEDPALRPAQTPGHSFACFYPVGTDEGDAALQHNLSRGATAAGAPVAVEGATVGD